MCQKTQFHCLIQAEHSKHCIVIKVQQNEGENSPNEVGDDEKLDDAVDDADGPALHHHRLGGFIGEEVCYAGPHPSSV